jgi:hypothetical protein
MAADEMPALRATADGPRVRKPDDHQAAEINSGSEYPAFAAAAAGGIVGGMADNAQKIADLEAITQAGVDRVTTDGVTVDFDQAAAREELRRLRAADDAQKGRRPVIATINLGSF